MIFLTVGTQLPFDRLVSSVDHWAGLHTSTEIFGQIGPAKYVPVHFKHERYLKAGQVDDFVKRASLVVAHAGMGSILTAMKFRRPIVVVPRDSSRGEHRNDHQIATAKWLENKCGVFVAWNESQLEDLLSRHESLESAEGISEYAPSEFTDRLRSFILS